MASGHLQGRLLKMIVQMIRPRYVLELGTFSGYSALCMAEGMDEGSELHTFEIFDEQEEFIRKWFEGSPWAERLHLHIGDALELVPQMDVRWDLAFIDADKRQYPEYYRMLLPLMKPGGFILADNTLWYGHVLEEDPEAGDQPTEQQETSGLPERPSRDGHKQSQTAGIQAFNDMVAADSRVEKVILPLRDGLTIIRVKELKG
jgi:predicted O-methyltransferase YrrM